MAIKRIDSTSLLPALQRGATVLVPNHRLRDALLSDIAERTEARVFRTPPVFAIDIWLREQWDLAAHCGMAPFAAWQVMGTGEELFLWQSLIEQSQADLPLLNPQETAREVNQSYRDLKQWLPFDSLRKLQPYASSPNTQAFLRWIKAYQRLCQERQLLALVDAIELVSGDTGIAWHTLPGMPTELLLVNFFEPPPLYQILFDRLAATITVSRHELLRNVAPTQQQRLACVDPAAELIACGRWARSQANANPQQHIGIICSEDVLSRPATRHLLCSALAATRFDTIHAPERMFNSSGSRRTLLDTGMVHDAFLLLGLVREQQASIDLCRLLQSPFVLPTAGETEARLQMELAMRRNASATTHLSDFSWHLQQAGRATHAPLLANALLQARTRARQLPGSASALHWAGHFATWLHEFAWPGPSMTAAEAEALQLWQDLLHRFAAASTIFGSMSQATALHYLQTLCAQQALPSPFQPDNPLSIYTVAEAIGLQFDHAWLLGFSTQAWPAAARPSAFIPHALQLQARLPGCHSSLQFARANRHFDIVCASVSAQLIASYPMTTGELACSPSSFISDWEPRVSEVNASAATLLHEPGASPLALVTVPDLAAHALLPQETVQGGQAIISNQSSCPFRAFATHRLQAEPLEVFANGLNMRDRGIALHTALESLFADIDSHATLLALDATAQAALVDRAVTEAIAFLSRRHRELMTPRFRQLEQARLAALLNRFLALERERGDFRVLAREESLQWQHAQLQLRLKVDRMDALADASLVLIDYKTGKRVSSTQRWLEERSENMQLPLYYTAATATQTQPVAAAVIAHVNAEKIAYSGLSSSAEVHKSLPAVDTNSKLSRSWSEITQQWQQSVRMRASEFVAGEAQVMPVNGRRTCQYCRLDALCRIRELDESVPDDETGPEEEA